MRILRLVVACILFRFGGAWVNERTGTLQQRPTPTVSKSSTQKKDGALLKFEIDQVYWSDPLEGNESEILHRFATSTKLRNRLITPHGRVEEFSLPLADLEVLQSNRRDFLPNIPISMPPSSMRATGLKFTTGAVNFPGLTIESTVQCGVSPCLDTSSLADWVVPPYEFNVLETTNTARGSRPMVWLFGKLDTPVSRSLTQAGLARRRPDGPLCLRYHSRARVEFGFHPGLLKALPLPQHRTEALGSQALEKAVRAEVQSCIKACLPLLQGP